MVTRLAASSQVEEEVPPALHGWHLDRKIPLALIGALLLQTLSIVWWAAGLDNRVADLEAHDATNLLMVERMARVEEKLTGLKEAVQRIEAKLERKTP